ncbi:MAG: hypothetical protein ACRD0G_20950 [Acidimicrobiales bacterium]
MRLTRRIGMLTLGSFLALTALAGCGDDGDKESTETTETTDAATGGAETTEGGALGSEECAELAEAAGAFSEAATGSEIDFGEQAARMTAMSDEAPAEIADDLAVLADAYAEADDAFGGEPVDFSDPENVAQLGEVASIFGDPEFSEAAMNIGTFAQSECGDG